jgi:two-component system CheB/CheR fusion protein
MGDSRGKPERERLPVVGVGASAGGIDALQRLFRGFEPDCGIAFVVVVHLAPQHRSILPEVLARASRMPVRVIEDGMTLEANLVHVIPPNATLTVKSGRLVLTTPPEGRVLRTPVDAFLISLAPEQGEDAAGVILSGTGSDGTQGLRAIKEHGGLTVGQADGEYDGMMRSAVNAGMVDFVLPVEAIPAKLNDYFHHLTSVSRLKGPDRVRQLAADQLAQICARLRTRTGHDFSDYKDRTVLRRVQRRMQVLQIDDVSQFIERLEKDPAQVDLLFQDMLIGVTNFFRDPDAFAALERIVPQLFEGKGAADAVRVWVPGCATGEEAYSIAMLLREHARNSVAVPKIQVFATDIDAQALETARSGRYPPSITRDVRPELLERYFLREEGSFRVISDLREICLFTPHNLLRDAPFSRLDLLSCRNLLIYLNQDLQDRVIPLFHYALRENGYLFLGTSENVTRHGALFDVVDKVQRLFRRRPQIARRLPDFPLTLPDAARSLARPRASAAVLASALQTVAHRRLLERYAPPYVVVTAEGSVLHASARTGRFLELPPGAPDIGIFSLARRGLRLELRAALHRAMTARQVATQKNVVVGTNGGQQTIDLYVEPLRLDGAAEPLYMIVFKEIGGVRPVPEEEEVRDVAEIESANLLQLEAELRATKDRLQTTTEQLESSNEALKSSNEELSSMNEELQSTIEELETSGEELQSINEELQTVNTELNIRVDELSRAHSDLQNLLDSTQIATVFLDRDMRVKGFTPAAKDLFHLVESDAGRPIGHVRARFSPDSITEDAERVLSTLTTVERQVHGSGANAGLLYVMRILPYRTVGNVVSGVVITFVDVTRVAAAEARVAELAHDLRNRVENLQTLLDIVPVGIFIMDDRASDEMLVNRRGAQLIGEPEDQRGPWPLSARLRLRVDGQDVPDAENPMQRAARSGAPVGGVEAALLRSDGSTTDVVVSATPLFDDAGQARGAIGAVVDISDITAHKATEARDLMLRRELQHRVKNVLATVGALAARMLKETPVPGEFTAGFLDRLAAMGRMHDLLSQRDWRGTDMRELVLATLAPYGGAARYDGALDGAALTLLPAPSATLGAILHELATNAAKYGALSVPDGKVSVTWRVVHDAAGQLVVLEWRESGGPPAQAPAAEGFGISFVRRSVAYELGGTFEAEFLKVGLHATLSFPLEGEGASEENAMKEAEA